MDENANISSVSTASRPCHVTPSTDRTCDTRARAGTHANTHTQTHTHITRYQESYFQQKEGQPCHATGDKRWISVHWSLIDYQYQHSLKKWVTCSTMFSSFSNLLYTSRLSASLLVVQETEPRGNPVVLQFVYAYCSLVTDLFVKSARVNSEVFTRQLHQPAQSHPAADPPRGAA
jgi:hypothetical protein